MTRRRSVLTIAGIAVSLLVGSAGAEPGPKVKAQKLVVFAAASLQDVFAEMAKDFEKERPGVVVTFNFAGTQELRTQLEQGAQVDVFASADQKHMSDLLEASRVVAPVVFTRNEPVIVVARESVEKLRSVADLPSAERIVVGVPEVPIGRYTLQILDRASATALGADFRSRVEAKVVSRELNVRQILTKVSLGEADAGIVYRTDARAAGNGVGVISISLDVNVIAEYPIAVVSNAANPTLARAWVDFVMSIEGQQMLGLAGFIAPTGSTQRK